MGALQVNEVVTGVPVRVLVVEDEVLIRMLVAETLRQDGCDVMEAASADEALALLGAADAPDVIVTDIRMPGRASGLDLAERARRQNPRIKVVIASAYHPECCRPGAADAFLTKPYGLQEVVEHVHALAVP